MANKKEENKLQIFKNKEFGDIRTIELNGEPWFVGKDVAEALGYNNPQEAIREHVDEEDKKMGERNATPSIKDSLGRLQYPTFINESGLYSLVLSSKLPDAKKFKRWITADVLPTIRKTGGYVNNEDAFINTYLPGVGEDVQKLFKLTLGTLRDANLKIQQLTEENDELKPKAAFADVIYGSDDCITVKEFAQIVSNQEGINFGVKRMNKWLCENHYMQRRRNYSGGFTYLPMQIMIDRGYMETHEIPFFNKYTQEPSSVVEVRVTGRGQDFLMRKIIEQAVFWNAERKDTSVS